MISLTASHLDCVVKEYVLSLTIESLLENDLNHIYVSISLGNYNANYLIEKYKKYNNVHIIVQKEKQVKQFEHFARLVKLIYDKYDKDTPILFCDDDDLLLNVPNVKYTRGYQYVPENTCGYDETYKMNQKQIKEICGKFEWSKHIDFSGYICPLSDVCEYFSTHKRFGYLEDVIFMEYMDKKIPDNKIEPFVFHRLWGTSDRPKSFWREQMGL